MGDLGNVIEATESGDRQVVPRPQPIVFWPIAAHDGHSFAARSPPGTPALFGVPDKPS